MWHSAAKPEVPWSSKKTRAGNISCAMIGYVFSWVMMAGKDRNGEVNVYK